MKRWKQSGKELLGYLASAAVFLGVVVFFVTAAMYLNKKADERGADTLRDAIRRSSVQCYAIEGRYPPSVEYLEENYGIQIDRNRYDVFYSGFASNLMPDITVNQKEEAGR